MQAPEFDDRVALVRSGRADDRVTEAHVRLLHQTSEQSEERENANDDSHLPPEWYSFYRSVSALCFLFLLNETFFLKLHSGLAV